MSVELVLVLAATGAALVGTWLVASAMDRSNRNR